jgi:hypothetical protein
MPRVARELPRSALNAVREFATVLMRMPNHVAGAVVREHAEVIDHAPANEDPKDGEELALREQVGFAGFPNRVRDGGHRRVHGEGLGLLILDETKDGADEAEHDAEVHQGESAHATEAVEPNLAQVRDVDIGFACAERGGGRHGQQGSSARPEGAAKLHRQGLWRR